MDRRIYILPVASVVILVILLARPDITGFVTADAGPEQSAISAQASVTIASDGFIPEDATITVALDDRSAAMKFSDFVARTGPNNMRVYEQIPGIGYEGYGYGGGTYALEISEFGIDTLVGPGEHTVSVVVAYGDSVLSSSEQNIKT